MQAYPASSVPEPVPGYKLQSVVSSPQARFLKPYSKASAGNSVSTKHCWLGCDSLTTDAARAASALPDSTESLFMKELRRRGVSSSQDLDTKERRGVDFKASSTAKSPFESIAGAGPLNSATKGGVFQGTPQEIEDQLERSRKLNSEGLEVGCCALGGWLRLLPVATSVLEPACSRGSACSGACIDADRFLNMSCRVSSPARLSC